MCDSFGFKKKKYCFLDRQPARIYWLSLPLLSFIPMQSSVSTSAALHDLLQAPEFFQPLWFIRSEIGLCVWERERENVLLIWKGQSSRAILEIHCSATCSWGLAGQSSGACGVQTYDENQDPSFAAFNQSNEIRLTCEPKGGGEGEWNGD